MMTARWQRRDLRFKHPGTTSRGVLHHKRSWYLMLEDTRKGALVAVGECSPIPGLSIDPLPDLESMLDALCRNLSSSLTDNQALTAHELEHFPSLEFGLECALLDLKSPADGILFPSAFTRGEQSIAINGLIWMGPIEDMERQIRNKLETGSHCVKLKIGGLDFEDEIALIQALRNRFGAEYLEIRVDANGAFQPETAMGQLEQLAGFELHSIEQPIQPGQWQEMARLCANTPLPIALDEELIGITSTGDQAQLLDDIRPQYIIIKPSLLGGFSRSRAWIDGAAERNIGWWVTSALESNIGLNAIAQWTATLPTTGYQGLGTGEIYANNLASPLQLRGEHLHYRPESGWHYDRLSLSD